MLKQGDKLMIAHRRLFQGDSARYFIGQVDAFEGGLAKVTGHSYVRDLISGRMLEKTEVRTKILSFSSGTLIVYQLPDSTSLETITFTWSESRLTVSDGQGFEMNLGEVTHSGKA